MQKKPIGISRENSSWYVVTGGPCSGKTTLISELHKKGYKIINETARTYIDGEVVKGKSLKEMTEDQSTFQKNILLMKIEAEKNLQKDKVIFFDRGIPDTDAYYRFYNIENEPTLEKALGECLYKKVFILDPLPYKTDYARVETKTEQEKIHDLLYYAYKALGIETIRVSIMPVEERLDFILKNL